ncbi:MAG: hypothetical protein K2X91_05220 [Thermoleophilia bacterium]|nr:hypothetical protein [Thermoleophilia bacterium]
MSEAAETATIPIAAPTSSGQASTIPSRRLEAACLACVAACAAWALWPLDRSGSTATADIAAQAEPAAEAPAPPLDLAAFRTPLWVAPVPPPTPPAPPPPPPPLRLQLIGIVDAPPGEQGSGTLAAVIFDPDTGRLHTVGAGASVGRAVVERVAAGAVSVREGALVRELRLRPQEARP